MPKQGSELQRELLFQTKQHELHEHELEAEIVLERQGAPSRIKRPKTKEADRRAYSLKAVIAPVQGLDWRVLMDLNPQGGDARNTVEMAFQELVTNAQKIGELNVSPDLLRTVVGNVVSRG